MTFKDYLNEMPDIAHLKGLDVYALDGELLHHIPAIEGKLGSLKVYYALAQQFNGQLNQQSAQQGLIWFAEHVQDAQQYQGKHPNIDLLLRVQNENLVYLLKPLVE